MMDGDWDILRVLASPPLLRLFKCTGWCGQFFMRKNISWRGGGSPEFHVPLWPCFPFFFPCYSLLIILVAQSTREKSKLCDHFSQNNFVFKGVVWTCVIRKSTIGEKGYFSLLLQLLIDTILVQWFFIDPFSVCSCWHTDHCVTGMVSTHHHLSPWFFCMNAHESALYVGKW